MIWIIVLILLGVIVFQHIRVVQMGKLIEEHERYEKALEENIRLRSMAKDGFKEITYERSAN